MNLAAGEKLSEDTCCNLLSRVGLCAKEYLRREIDATLSGGEMKRLEIASVLAKPHKLCIFDEPEAGIDLWSFSMLVKQFEQLHKEKKETLILISHQDGLSGCRPYYGDPDGKVAALGTKEEVYPMLMESNLPTECEKLR